MDKRKGNTDLTEGKVWKVIIRFALPLLIGNLLQQFYNITDSIIVGQFLGKEALIPYINEEGDVTEVCIGTNKKNDKQYYYDRRRIVGDYHGQAPILWCCFALIE